ncbi:ZapG family protein [Blochmannia endosymbiont of Camponotus (Colobopsis) obliquus]|uniref:ZapG family protein n=1 Tax=Blochmannia endosymbiont of Camponotus (Colobopsis) obliquus TaxID=1505597 RepID=UPI00061A8439|nr:Putative cytochrome d ubiquinol oxidase subunit 3 [Blochmannia endosymbiont of Camponotus (Colobopsis) obliquus]
MWKYISISFIFGLILGIMIAWLRQYIFKQNLSIKNYTHNNINKLNEYETKLINHFTHIAALLNDINNHHCKFHQYMSNSIHDLLKNKNLEYNVIPYNDSLSKKNNNDLKSNKMQPRDYSENITDK